MAVGLVQRVGGDVSLRAGLAHGEVLDLALDCRVVAFEPVHDDLDHTLAVVDATRRTDLEEVPDQQRLDLLALRSRGVVMGDRFAFAQLGNDFRRGLHGEKDCSFDVALELHTDSQMPQVVTTSARHRREFARLRHRLEHGDPYWPAQLALLIAVASSALLSDGVRVGPLWLFPLVELALVFALIAFAPRRADRELGGRRTLALVIVGLIALSNLVSLGLLIERLVGSGITNGEALILSGVVIWIKNILIFAVFLWEFDRGGPFHRFNNAAALPDIQFPQLENPSLTIPNWRPGFGDYLYVSLTNATAFSPTDAMPMTLTAKAIMAAESLSSFMTIGLVIARAVNILG